MHQVSLYGVPLATVFLWRERDSSIIDCWLCRQVFVAEREWLRRKGSLFCVGDLSCILNPRAEESHLRRCYVTSVRAFILASSIISAPTSQQSSTNASGGRKRTTQRSSFAKYSSVHVRRLRWQLGLLRLRCADSGGPSCDIHLIHMPA